MLVQRFGQSTRAACSSRPAQQRRVVVARASADSSSSQATRMLSAGAAAAVAMVMLASPVNAAPQYSTLADLFRQEFEFVDTNKDGKVTLAELESLSAEIAEEEGFAEPSEEQLAFTLRLFDLNQDGQLRTDEVLTSLALDAVVSEDAVDADAVKVFDRNGDGYVERSEWSEPFGDLGRQGEVAKEYIFERVDHLYDGNDKLDTRELVNALNLMRTVALGY